MNNIKSLRKRAEITQRAISHILGVSQQCVSKWEKGICDPRSNQLPKIAQILNCTIDELLKNNESDYSEETEV